MHRTRVGVLRGGPSSQYDISLQTGGLVLEALDTERFEPVDIFIDRAGKWHIRGVAVLEGRALRNADVVFNTLRGEYGEDGIVQKIFATYRLPHTGADALGSALASNKALAKKHLSNAGILVPSGRVLTVEVGIDDSLRRLFREQQSPYVVKPTSSGSSHGVSIVETFHDLVEAVRHAFEYARSVLVEEYISGREVMTGVIEGLRGSSHYGMLPVETIRTNEKLFNDRLSHFSEGSSTHCPAGITQAESEAIQNLALLAHTILGLSQYSHSDFILTDDGKVYCLEVNTQPTLGEHSALTASLEGAGVSLSEFVTHLVETADARS